MVREIAERLSAASVATPGVLVVGSAGIGKTDLVRRVREQLASERDAVVVSGSESTRAVPLGIFMGVPGLEPRPEPEQVIRAFTRARNRTVLVVDNVDRLDSPSSAVLHRLINEVRLPVLLTLRRQQDLPTSLLESYDAGLITPHVLAPLDTEATGQVAEAVLGERMTPAARRVVADAAQGNPLYVRELITACRAARTLIPTEHGWDFDGPLRATPRLVELISGGLASLGAVELDLLAMVALADQLPLHVVEQMHGDALGVLRRRGVAEVTDGWVRLSHALYGEAHLSGVAPTHRAHLVSDALRMLEVSGAGSSRPALALLLSGEGPVPVDLTLAEAQRALELLDFPRAATLADRLAEQLPEDPRVLRIRGEAASGSGRPDAAGVLLRAMREAATRKDGEGMARAALALARHQAVRSHDVSAAIATLERTVDHLDESDWRDRVATELQRWRIDADLAALMPSNPGGGEDDSALLTAELLVAVVEGPHARAAELSRELDQLHTGRTGELPAIAGVLRLLVRAFSGDLTTARTLAHTALRDGDVPQMRGSWEYALGIVELLAGEVEAAAALAEAAVPNLAWRDPLGLHGAAIALAHGSLTALGRDLDAAAYAERLPDAVRSDADPKVVVVDARARAAREADAGRRGAAARTLLEAAQRLADGDRVFMAGALAHDVARLGRTDQVADLLGRLAERGGGMVTLFDRHQVALAARDVDELSELCEIFISLGLLGSAIDTGLTLAEIVRARGDVMTARRWERRVAELRSQAPSTRVWSFQSSDDDLELLSPREAEVVDLARQRLRSKEIAAHLGISVKTVDNHLSAAYRKLGLSGRNELEQYSGDLTSLKDRSTQPHLRLRR